jgi:lipoprotein-releasing system permease protein
MVVVLSAFNGLEGLIVDLYTSWDPGLKVEPKAGKFIPQDTTLVGKLSALAGVQKVYAVAEDNALLRFDGGQAVVRIKGIDPSYGQRAGLGKTLVAGRFQLGVPGAWGVVIGAGLEYNLQIPLNSGFDGAQIWYPRDGKNVGLDPRSAFARQAVIATGVFQVEKQYDERYVFADRRLVAGLMGQPDACTALEIDLLPEKDPKTVAQQVRDVVGPAYTVKTSAQQHESLMRVLLIERLFVILAFVVILLIASFNIFTALSMLAVEKKRALAVLGAMGATPALIRNTFLGVGLAISSLGACVGVGLGIGLCWLQDQYKLVSMGMQAAIVQEYPVRVLQPDLWLIASTVILVSLAVSWVPAQGAVLAAKAGTRA